jgi:predicted alpha/beta-hydrolase family hydrolase
MRGRGAGFEQRSLSRMRRQQSRTAAFPLRGWQRKQQERVFTFCGTMRFLRRSTRARLLLDELNYLVTSRTTIEAFTSDTLEPHVRGFLHLPESGNGDALILTHGAGSNCHAPLLVALAGAFADAGFAVLRCDLPFRQMRPKGPPVPGNTAQANDRAGLANTVALMKQRFPGRIFLGGHSYGGRQASMLAAEQQNIADGLLLFSYPLHPPGRPTQRRDGHFPKLVIPAIFVLGAKDTFGTPEEIREALKLIPGKTTLIEIEGAGHDLAKKGRGADKYGGLVQRVIEVLSQRSV